MEPTAPASGPVAARRGRVAAVGAVLLVAAFALGAWAFARGNTPFAVDEWWNTIMAGAPAPLLSGFSRLMNVAGGALVSLVILPAAGIALLLARRRPRAAGYLLVAVIASVLVVQVLKHLFGRARPEQIVVVSDYGSYPSGHVANAATLAAVLVVLLPRVWTVVAGLAWVLLMALSRTYLHAHWLSDTLGGALVGVGAAMLVAAALAGPLGRGGPR